MCVIFNFSNGSSLCNCGLHLQFSSKDSKTNEIRDLTELLFKDHFKCDPHILEGF